jgi:hypothetical protein
MYLLVWIHSHDCVRVQAMELMLTSVRVQAMELMLTINEAGAVLRTARGAPDVEDTFRAFIEVMRVVLFHTSVPKFVL